MLRVIFLFVYSYSVQAMAFILYLSSFLETLVLSHNLVNQLYEKHADKFIPRGGLGGRAYPSCALARQTMYLRLTGG